MEASLEAPAMPLKDPTRASQAVYARISSPGEVDLYHFTVGKDDEIPVMLLMPIRKSNKDFSPRLVLLTPGELDLGTTLTSGDFDFTVPEGYSAYLLPWNDPWDTFFEPFSIEKLYVVSEIDLKVTQGEKYYMGVFTNDYSQGDYTIGIGTVEDFIDRNLLFCWGYTTTL